MDIFISILLLLVFSRLLGEFMERIGQLAITGEILAGIILGSFSFIILGYAIIPYDIQKGDDLTKSLKLIAEIGFFFFLFYAGLEISVDDIKKSIKKGLLLFGFSYSLPFFFGVILGFIFLPNDYYPNKIIASLVLGILISITALPVGIRLLMDIGKFNTELGKTIISAVILGDVIGLTFLMFIGRLLTNGIVDVFTIVVAVIKVLIFIFVFLSVDYLFKVRYEIVSLYFAHYLRKFRTRESYFAIPLIIAISFGLLAQSLGLHFILGGFFAGLIFHKGNIGERSFEKLSSSTTAITMGFLAPIFFAVIGLQFDLSVFYKKELIIFLLSVLFFAVFGKIVGAYIGARLSNFNKKESKLIAIIMSGKGAIGIVMAGIALSLGLIQRDIFSITVAIGFATTMMALFLAKKFC